MAVNTGAGSAGALTFEQVKEVLIQPLTQTAKFLSAGPRIYDSPGGNEIRLPKLVTSTAPSWHGENELIDEVDVEFEGINLLPRDMKSLKSLIPMSNEVLRASVIPLESALRDRLVYDVAIKLDAQLFAGTGGTPAGTEPLGMANWTGVQEIDLADAALTLDDLHDAVGAAESAYANPTVIFMSPERLTYLRKLKDDYARYQFTPQPTEDTRSQFAGVPIITTTFLEDTIAVVDMDQVAVARDLEPSVRVLDQTRADYDQTLIRVVTRYDVAPLNAEGVVLITNPEALA